MIHLDPGVVLEIDIENDADRLLEVVVVLKGLRRFEQHAVVAVLFQKPLDTPEHAGVVIDHKHRSLFQQDRWSCSANWKSRTPGRRPSGCQIGRPPNVPNLSRRQIEATAWNRSLSFT